jgi:hypothetical protein
MYRREVTALLPSEEPLLENEEEIENLAVSITTAIDTARVLAVPTSQWRPFNHLELPDYIFRKIHQRNRLRRKFQRSRRRATVSDSTSPAPADDPGT